MTEQAWHERLKALRKGAGLTQIQVAECIGVIRTTYVAIEAGTRAIRSDELAKLAELYGVPTDEILTMEIVHTPQPQLARSWLSVSGDEALLLQFVRANDLRGAIRCLIDMGVE